MQDEDLELELAARAIARRYPDPDEDDIDVILGRLSEGLDPSDADAGDDDEVEGAVLGALLARVTSRPPVVQRSGAVTTRISRVMTVPPALAAKVSSAVTAMQARGVASGNRALAVAQRIARRMPRASRKLAAVGTRMMQRSTSTAVRGVILGDAVSVGPPTGTRSSVIQTIKTTYDPVFAAIYNAWVAACDALSDAADLVGQVADASIALGASDPRATSGQAIVARTQDLIDAFPDDLDPSVDYTPFSAQAAQIKTDAVTWLQSAGAYSPAGGAAAPFSPGAGGGGSDGGDDDGREGSASAEVKKFRESGGAYDPFADESADNGNDGGGDDGGGDAGGDGEDGGGEDADAGDDSAPAADDDNSDAADAVVGAMADLIMGSFPPAKTTMWGAVRRQRRAARRR